MIFQLKLFCKVIAATTLMVAGMAAHAQPLRRDLPENVVQFSASGTQEVQQDVLAIVMSTTRDGADAATVQSQLKQALEVALVQARQALAPGQLDVRTGNFNLYPRYGKDGKINGWQGSTELVLEGKDFLRITSVAGKIQTLTMANVSFALSREQRARVEAEAQTQAIERFKLKALEIAMGFGFRSYSLREVSVNTNDQGPVPRPRMMAMQTRSDASEAPVSVEAGKSTVLVTVSGSVQMH